MKKLYFLKDNRGSYYNWVDKEFRRSFVNASYTTNKSHLERLDTGLEIVSFTEDDFMIAISEKIGEAVISGSQFYEVLKNIDYIIPTTGKKTKELKKNLKPFLVYLQDFVKFRDEMINVEEDVIDEFTGNYGSFIDRLSKVKISQTRETEMVVHALTEDRKSMLGLAKKVLKHKGFDVKFVD